MSSKDLAKKAIGSKIMSSATPNPASFATGLVDCAKSITDYLKVKEVEQTKRSEIQAKRDVAIAMIQSHRDVLLSFVEKT